MRGVATITVFALYIVWIFPYPTNGTTDQLSTDFIYFPDQAEYIKLAVKCPANTIMWPGNRRCYREGEQGPCNIGRVLVFDKRLLKPYCKNSPLA